MPGGAESSRGNLDRIERWRRESADHPRAMGHRAFHDLSGLWRDPECHSTSFGVSDANGPSRSSCNERISPPRRHARNAGGTPRWSGCGHPSQDAWAGGVPRWAREWVRLLIGARRAPERSRDPGRGGRPAGFAAGARRRGYRPHGGSTARGWHRWPMRRIGLSAYRLALSIKQQPMPARASR